MKVKLERKVSGDVRLCGLDGIVLSCMQTTIFCLQLADSEFAKVN